MESTDAIFHTVLSNRPVYKSSTLVSSTQVLYKGRRSKIGVAGIQKNLNFKFHSI